MKWIILAMTLAFSGSVLADHRGGVPSVPCYIDGKLEANLPVNECRRRGGKVAGEK